MGATTSTTAGSSNFTFPLKLEMDEPLSRARFLKSHRCHDENGYFVVKTYVKPPGYTATKDYKKELESIKRYPTSHTAAYQYIVENEKTIQGVRQYFHSSLSARLNTLPFLTKIEKKWITYQLLVYLEKAEKWGLFHGDLKCENVMLTSWNWIFITDHAFSYKPIYLPAQNYGGFSYFFDTSNRTCYMAPERFGGSDENGVNNAANPEEVELKLGEKRAKMDIFSMGCVIAELWLEQDRRLFEYGSMLRYKDGSDEPLNILQNIQEPGIRQLVTDMVHRDPEKRRSAISYLRQWTGTLFPSYFETLHDAISKILTAPPNERVRRISLSLEDLHKLFTERQGVPASHAAFIQSVLPPGSKTTMPTSPTSAPFVDLPTPFEATPFASPATPSKSDAAAIAAAVQPLLNEDARLELAVKFPTLPATDSAATLSEALLRAGHFDEDKLEALVATCSSAESLLPIVKLLESVLKQDSLFDAPKPKPNANSSALGNARASPEFKSSQLAKDETRFLDGQGGLMSATLATEHLLRKLLSDQENDRLLRDVDVNSFTSEEIRKILEDRPLHLLLENAQPADAALLALSQTELQFRKLLEESYAALEELNAAVGEPAEESTEVSPVTAAPSTPGGHVSASQNSSLMERKEIEQKLMVALEKLSTLYRERGEFRHALSFQRAYLGRAKHWKDSISLLRGFQQYGYTFHAMGDHENAIRSYKQALTFANNLKSKRHLLDLFHLLGEAHADKSDLQTATYYHRLLEDLQGELKGTTDDSKYGAQSQRNISGSVVGHSVGHSSPAFGRGAIAVTTHKLLSSPRTPGRAPSQSVSHGSSSPAPFNGINTPTRTAPSARFSAAVGGAHSAEVASAVAEYLPSDEPGTLGYVIILDILCAMLPYLTDTGLKLTCLDCLARISHYADDEVRLQRLVPTLVSYLDSTRDASALVRAQTIKTLAHIISLVNEFPIDDAHIFQDYLIPVLKFVLKEERETIVHQAFAAALPKLAKSARLCLDHSQLHRTHHRSATGTGSGALEVSQQQLSRDPRKKDSGYADDLRELRQEFHNILNEWLENSSLIVKRTVLEDIGTLAEFFGSEDTNNHLLQLIFSWLNFSDWELKCAVFDNIVGVSQVAGPNAIESYIESYLPIHDESEFVIDSAVNCLASLTEAGIFSPQKLREYTIQVAPLLLHPNAWIRFATVQFLSKISRRLSPIEVQCFIIPHIRRFLKHDITSLTHTTLLQAMIPPVSRSAYEKVMTSLNLNTTKESFVAPTSKSDHSSGLAASLAATDGMSSNVRRFNLLSADSGLNDFVVIEPNSTSSPSTPKAHLALQSSMASGDGERISPAVDLPFSLGLAELDLEGQDEEKLFWMKEYVKEARRARIDKRSTLTTDSWASEYTRLSKEKTIHDIAQFLTPVQTATSALLPSLDTTGPDEPTELWKAMFGSTSSAMQPSSTPSVSANSNAQQALTGLESTAVSKAMQTPIGTQQQHQVVPPSTRHPEDDPKVTVLDSAPPSSIRGGDFGSGPASGAPQQVSTASNIPSGAPGSSSMRAGADANAPLNLGPIRASKLAAASATSNWTPQGLLVATLSEHEEAVTQLQVARDGAFFASGSHDKKVKIWDSQQFEHNGPLRSACTYYGLGSAVTSISICQDSHSVAAASINGSIHVFRVDAGSNLPKGTSAPPNANASSMAGNTNGGVVGVPGSASASTSGVYTSANSVGTGAASNATTSASYGMTATVVRRLDQTDGVILKVEHFDKDAGSLIVYATDRGDIRAWDLRTQKEPWAVSNSPHLGLITSLLIDPQRNWLAVGTDAGNFTCWDLRFRVPLLNWTLPTLDGLCGIHNLAADPLQNGAFWASFGPGLVAHFNLETKQCRRVLRVAPREFSSSSSASPSTGPNAHDWDSLLVPKEDSASSGDDFRIADLQRPLTESARSLEAHLNTIRAMSVSPNGNFVITGGADKKLRFWNFENPHKSFIISGKDPKEDVTYNAWDSHSKNIAGLEEVRTPIRESPHIHATQQLPSSGHCDTILDTKLLELHSKKVMVVSASRDGVIKVWK